MSSKDYYVIPIHLDRDVAIKTDKEIETNFYKEYEIKEAGIDFELYDLIHKAEQKLIDLYKKISELDKQLQSFNTDLDSSKSQVVSELESYMSIIKDGIQKSAKSYIDNYVKYSAGLLNIEVDNKLKQSGYVRGDEFANFLTLSSKVSTDSNSSYGAISIINSNLNDTKELSSTVLIEADKFAVTSLKLDEVDKVDESQVYVPFSIDTKTKTLNFNGKVTFTNSNIDTSCYSYYVSQIKFLVENKGIDPAQARIQAIDETKKINKCKDFDVNTDITGVLGGYLVNSNIITEQLISNKGFLNLLTLGFQTGDFGGSAKADTNKFKQIKPDIQTYLVELPVYFTTFEYKGENYLKFLLDKNSDVDLVIKYPSAIDRVELLDIDSFKSLTQQYSKAKDKVFYFSIFFR